MMGGQARAELILEQLGTDQQIWNLILTKILKRFSMARPTAAGQ